MMKKNDTVIILGSSRSDGDTRKIVDFLLAETTWGLVDLNDYAISYYDYDHKNQQDDFLPLMDKLIENYQNVIFATPVYWYTMSAVMKTFFDRLSDLLTIRKEMGRKLRGKAMGLVSCGDERVLTAGFDMPFRETARYLGMGYFGHVHTWLEGGEIAPETGKDIRRFISMIETI